MKPKIHGEFEDGEREPPPHLPVDRCRVDSLWQGKHGLAREAPFVAADHAVGEWRQQLPVEPAGKLSPGDPGAVGGEGLACGIVGSRPHGERLAAEAARLQPHQGVANLLLRGLWRLFA